MRTSKARRVLSTFAALAVALSASLSFTQSTSAVAQAATAPMENDIVVDLTVTLNGLALPTSARIPAHIQIQDAGTTVTRDYNYLLNEFTKVLFTVPATCGYTQFLWVKTPKHRAALTRFTADCFHNNITGVVLYGGDANNDNLCNLIDYNLVQRYYGEGCSTPGYDARSDLDYDCVTGIADFNIVKANYGMAGAPPLIGPCCGPSQ